MHTSIPVGVDGLDDLGLHCLETTLVCFIFNDKLFVFYNLAQLVDFIGTYGGQERVGLQEATKEMEPVKKAVYELLLRIMPMSPWPPLPLVNAVI